MPRACGARSACQNGSRSMRAALAVVIVIAIALASAGRATADDAGVAATSARPGGSSEAAGPAATGARWERPPAGTLASGALGVPQWAVVLAGASIVIAASAALLAAARRSRRRSAR